jgi:basic membrane protein A
MVASGSLGDLGIFDSGNAGLTRGKSSFGVCFRVLEGNNNPSVYNNILLTAARAYPVVFVNPGYQFDSYLPAVTKEFPKTLFVYTDGIAPKPKKNELSVFYKQNEGSYVAGVEAAMMTTRTGIKGINPQKVVGIVGAVDAPVIRDFIVGFKQGVASINPSVQVKVLFAGSFSDPVLGKRLALSLYNQGADIVYQVAAKTGDGVIAAAVQTGHYAIGVDSNKCFQGPKNVIGSNIKNVGQSYYLIEQKWAHHTLKANGTVMPFGLKQGAVGFDFAHDTCLNNLVPKDIIARMKLVTRQIIQGKIKVKSAITH